MELFIFFCNCLNFFSLSMCCFYNYNNFFPVGAEPAGADVTDTGGRDPSGRAGGAGSAINAPTLESLASRGSSFPFLNLFY